MYEANQNAIVLTKNPQINERTKYINVTAHYIRELINYEKIEIHYKHTNEMLIDVLTKPLNKDKFLSLKDRIGLVNRPIIE